jgi:ERCC4-type nuclease
MYAHWFHNYGDGYHKSKKYNLRIRIPRPYKHYVLINMIIIDTREPKNIREMLVNRLKAENVRYSLTSLAGKADYLITGKTCMAIQRKTVKDFINNISKINDTIAELRDSYSSFIPMLLLEGIYDAGGEFVNGYHLQSSSLNNILLSMQMKGIVVFNTMSISHTINALVSWHSWCQKETHNSLEKHYQENIVEHIYSHIPGIGEELARKLYNVYPSIDMLVKANIVDLMKISGIGKEKAEQIHKFLRFPNIKY